MCALHLAATIAQKVSTNSMLDNGISASSEAIHTLCDILDISHANLLLHQTSDVLESFEPSGSVKVQFLLAKSHYLLVAGKVRLSLNHLYSFALFPSSQGKNYKSRATYLQCNVVCYKVYLTFIKVYHLHLAMYECLLIFYACQCLYVYMKFTKA